MSFTFFPNLFGVLPVRAGERTEPLPLDVFPGVPDAAGIVRAFVRVAFHHQQPEPAPPPQLTLSVGAGEAVPLPPGQFHPIYTGPEQTGSEAAARVTDEGSVARLEIAFIGVDPGEFTGWKLVIANPNPPDPADINAGILFYSGFCAATDEETKQPWIYVPTTEITILSGFPETLALINNFGTAPLKIEKLVRSPELPPSNIRLVPASIAPGWQQYTIVAESPAPGEYVFIIESNDEQSPRERDVKIVVLDPDARPVIHVPPQEVNMPFFPEDAPPPSGSVTVMAQIENRGSAPLEVTGMRHFEDDFQFPEGYHPRLYCVPTTVPPGIHELSIVNEYSLEGSYKFEIESNDNAVDRQRMLSISVG